MSLLMNAGFSLQADRLSMIASRLARHHHGVIERCVIAIARQSSCDALQKLTRCSHNPDVMIDQQRGEQ